MSKLDEKIIRLNELKALIDGFEPTKSQDIEDKDKIKMFDSIHAAALASFEQFRKDGAMDGALVAQLINDCYEVLGENVHPVMEALTEFVDI